MAQRHYIFEATRENFPALVLENSRKGLVLVDFWAPWAGPSLRQREMLTELANEYGGRFLLATVNTDDQKQLANDYGVRSLPLCKLFRNGRVVETLRGVQPRGDYRKLVDDNLVALTSKVQRAALRLWEGGDHEKAIQVLAEGAMAEPADLELPLLLSKLLMRLQRLGDARAVLAALPPEAREHPGIARLLAHQEFLLVAESAPERPELEALVGEDPERLDARYQLASRLLLNDEYEAAIEQLLKILRRQRDFGDGAARNGLLAIFDILGSEDSRVRQYRAQLFRLIH